MESNNEISLYRKTNKNQLCNNSNEDMHKLNKEI